MGVMLFIPAFNCEKQIGRVISQFTPDIQRLLSEIVVVNNRSNDGTEWVAIQAIRKLEHVDAVVLTNDDNYGLGGSHKVAFERAIEKGYDFVVMLHGNDQGKINDLIPLIESHKHHQYDCLLGARFHPAAQAIGYSWFRKFSNKVFNRLFSMVAGQRLYDLGSGLNMYKTEVLKDRFYKKFPDNLTFNYCMILGSCHLQQDIHFFPISWRETDQVSNVRLLKQTIQVINILWTYFKDPDGFMMKDFTNGKTTYNSKSIANNLRNGKVA